ncbi:MAG: M56 family metallopeptidase [Pseudomonadota bacterium]
MSVFASSFDLSAVLLDTLIWTAALIVLVLLLRRPVTRWFGAPAAYALWTLPILRLFLPPIELPAWLAPTKEAAPQLAEASGGTVIIELGAAAPAAVALEAPVEETSTLLTSLASLPLTEIALTAWLGGAAVFLYLRFSAYFRLRGELMQDAVEVGTTKGPLGTIRLIETPGTNAPLAFGVREPVIALPPGFMASPDSAARDARDLALAHELEHHRGHDLLINVLAQPLFALHWFNPLGRYGWLALRRDQEAACDARVMASANKETRALYANVIASFAAGPNVALAAPMACPVLGDKSIIQRLRNLKMNDDASNTKSRKLASRLMLGTAVLALPLTASVTYAESLAPAAPQPPAPPAVSAAPPAPPAPPAPMLNALLQAAPKAPEAPEPPAAPLGKAKEKGVAIITIDPETGETRSIDAGAQSSKIKIKDKDVTVISSYVDDEGKKSKSRYRKVKIVNDGERLTEEEREEIMEEVRESLAEVDVELKELEVELKELENSEDWTAFAKRGEGRTIVRMECNGSSDDVATTKELADGTRKVMICQSRVMAQALQGLEQARAAIAENREIEGTMRREILGELDKQIREWRKETR